jgi:hypothetical protein
MKMKTDEEIDADLRAASTFPVDEAQIARAVLTRIRDDDAGLFGIFGGHKRGIAVGFATVLVATPIIVTQIPAASQDAMIASALLGEGLLDHGVLDVLLTDEGLE